ncbi:hypothetical protein ENUP19_0376G0007 [Entamoeba nuttalli]|uniref:ABC transmembrane type-1 domain-containing protein n=1 Tax=Entamoeba nuttalli TaxID=412467 RepID=A0ABQ0DZ35_9EUKA
MRTFSLFVVSQREGIRPRRLYFKSLLRQDTTWYDYQESGELTSRIAANIKKYQDGIGPKFGMIFQIFSMGITGYVIGFKKCWDLVLVVLETSIGDECPNECNGNIRFEDVQFVYPTRLSHHVLKGFDLEIKKGETIALVGASGCGNQLQFN